MKKRTASSVCKQPPKKKAYKARIKHSCIASILGLYGLTILYKNNILTMTENEIGDTMESLRLLHNSEAENTGDFAVGSLKDTKKPTPSKKIRRRANGSSITPVDPRKPAKVIYLVRHGQSLGQTAKQNGLDRKRDKRLTDCMMTEEGQRQATQVPDLLGKCTLDSIQLVVSSPLTRALQTAVIAFPSKNILVNYDLREVGSKVPENQPRSMDFVLTDLKEYLSYREEGLVLDVEALCPKDWPRDFSPAVIKKERIRNVFQWLYKEREETIMAVVCHYNVIRSAVIDGTQLRPENAVPIRCKLLSNGDLVLDP